MYQNFFIASKANPLLNTSTSWTQLQGRQRPLRSHDDYDHFEASNYDFEEGCESHWFQIWEESLKKGKKVARFKFEQSEFPFSKFC